VTWIKLSLFKKTCDVWLVWKQHVSGVTDETSVRVYVSPGFCLPVSLLRVVFMPVKSLKPVISTLRRRLIKTHTHSLFQAVHVSYVVFVSVQMFTSWIWPILHYMLIWTAYGVFHVTFKPSDGGVRTTDIAADSASEASELLQDLNLSDTFLKETSHFNNQIINRLQVKNIQR